MIKIKELKVDYSTQKSISYSQYSLYEQCPHQWYLNYVRGLLNFKPSIHLTFGTSMHEVFQEYLRIMYTDSVVAANKVDYCKLLKDRMFENYSKSLESNQGVHYSTPKELTEFYEDGKVIIEWFLKKRNLYFSKKKVKLVGIEVPLVSKIVDNLENLVFRGHVDFILYDEVLDKYTVYDIKTSTRGWKDAEKSDKVKISQILLYKKFFSEIYNIPIEKVDVVYLILKRKIFEQSEFPIPRIQTFSPASGTVSINKALKGIGKFIEDVYNPDRTYRDKEYEKRPSKLCGWCPYNDKPELCNKVN